MKIESLNLINFRNYNFLNMDFSSGVNMLIGDNARGKTNLMEAISYSVSMKSLRKSSDRDLIKFGNDEGYIGAVINESGLSKFIEVKFLRNKHKRIRINKNEISSFKELNLRCAIVSFIPEDLYIVKGSPSLRRDYIDDILSKVYPLFRYNLSRYNKIIYERNNLLKSLFSRNEVERLLDIYDAEMVKYARFIYSERIKLISELNELLSDILYDITNGKERVKLILSSDLNKSDFEKNLKNIRKNDLIKKYTSLGIHRDDLLISLNGLDARKFSSQGQQRTIVLALKLCELQYLKQKLGEQPILLLDDVFSELDENRCKNLIESFGDSQVFISSTEIPLNLNMNYMIYKIEENGKIKSLN